MLTKKYQIICNIEKLLIVQVTKDANERLKGDWFKEIC
jgi:hypothetical protein